MLSILPDEVKILLDTWHDSDRVSITPAGIAALDACAPSSPRCPKCGGKLSFEMLYCGGRGYQPYTICQSEGDCDFMARGN